MADLIVNSDGTIGVSNKKKKKKKTADLVVGSDGKITVNRVTSNYNKGGYGAFGGIAPIKSTNKKAKRTWFDKGAFDDGYDIGDITKTILGTTSDIQGDLMTGVGRILEGGIDTGAWLVGKGAELTGNKKLADKTKDFIKTDFITETGFGERASNSGTIGLLNSLVNKDDNMFTTPIELAKNLKKGDGYLEALKKSGTSSNYESNSLLGDKSDSLTQSAGQLAGTIGLQAVGVPWWVTTGVTSFGGETQNAFNSGATYNEAGASGLISAGAEILTEKLSGGISFGGKTLDKGLKDTLTKSISNETIKTLTKLGFDMAGEGAEEVLSSVISNVGKKLTYEDDKTWNDMLLSKEAMDEYLESFIGGAVLGGGFNIGRTAKSIKTGRDYDTGLSKNEQSVIDIETTNRVNEQERNTGKKLTKKEVAKINEEVAEDLRKGYISTDLIEKALGGEEYRSYRDTQDKVDKIKKEINDLESKKMSDMNVGEWNTTTQRLNSLREELKNIDTNTPKANLEAKMSNITKSDWVLQRSYEEKSNRSKKYEADLNKYDTKQQETIKKAIDSGILNNTTKTHEFVDMVAKLSADKGVSFDFTNNQKLKDSGFAVDGKQVNGFVNQNGVTVNIDSSKALNRVVGHEITHVLEGTELYTELQQAVKEYATTKGEYDTKLAEFTEMYKNVEGANVENELTSDLVGDYLFTDADFVKNLSTTKPNVFKKIYNEIKYMLKIATAGSKEARQLEKVKKTFEEAYKNSEKNLTNDTKYSISENNTDLDILLKDNNLSLRKNGSLEYKNLNEKQINQLVKIYQKNGYSDVSADYLKESINRGNAFIPREVTDEFIKKVLKYTPNYDTTQIYEDAEGNPLTKEQVDFYKDSDVRDIRGRLIPVYHRTNSDFTVFDSKAGKQHGNKYGKGFYFSITPENYGNRTIKAYLNAKEGEYKYIPSKGYYVVQNNNAIKLVDNTNPTSDADIRYSLSDNKGNEIPEKMQKWAKDSKARDENGQLKVLYHGTATGEFTVFDKNMASPEGDWGAGFYLTDNESDVEKNYEDGGPDFDNRVERLAEQIESEQDIPFDEAKKQAREQLYKGSYKITSYVDIENPAIVGETYILDGSTYDIKDIDDYDGDIDSYYSDLVYDIVEDVQYNTNLYGDTTELSNLLYEATYNGGIEIQELKNRINELYLENDEGQIIGNEVAREILEYLGYDGIIDPTVSTKWNMYMEEGTTHYIVFKPNQIKNITNQNPTDNPDINLSLSNQNEQIAPTKGDVYGEDVKLQEQIAPLQESVDNLSQKVNEIADKMDKQLLGTPVTENDLPYLEQQYADDFKNTDYDNIPYEEGNLGELAPEVEIKNKKDIIEKIRRNFNIKVKEAQDLYNRIANQEDITIDDVAAELSRYSDFKIETDDPLFNKEARDFIRNTTIDMSYLKNQITDYNLFRRSNMGRLRLGNSGVPIDTFYQELVNMYPGEFDSNILTEADMLEALSDYMFRDNKMVEEYSLDSDEIYRLASDIYNDIKNKEKYKASLQLQKELAKNMKYMEDIEEYASNTEVTEEIAPTKEQKIIPKDPTKEDSYDNDIVKKTKKELRKALMGTEAQKQFIQDVLDNAKNRSMALMNNTDTIRNTELVFGRENGKIINDLIFQKEIDNEADSIKWQNRQRQEIKDLGIKARSKESAAVQKYGEKQWVNDKGEVLTYGDAELASEFKNIETQNKIKNAAQEIRKKYDDYIDKANEVLTKLGFDPIKKRNDYMRHFQELNDVFTRYGIPFNAQNMQEHSLPTDINGLTEYWSPQKNYFANMQPRKGIKTTYDAITGVDGYISGIANLIYHTEDIQRGRAFEELIRETYGEDKGWDNLENLPDELKQARADKIQDNHLSNYAAWVHEWTNNIAGKKSKVDRSIESMFGRKAFSFLDETRKQVGANMIGLNLSSSMTNLIAPVQAMAKTNKLAVVKGTADTIKNIFIKDNFMDKNKFLTSRMGTDMISKNAWQKVQNAGYVFMKGMDWFSSNQIVRSKYYELRSKGMSESEAHAEAGKFAARILGNRTKGANAQLYNSKLIGLVTQFQLEVNNQLYSQFYDTYHESKESAQGNALKTAAGMTFTLGQLFAFTHLFGQTFETIAGYNPTFDVIEMIKTAFGLGDDDDEEKTTSERLKKAADMLVDALPYVNILTGGGRIPIASSIPNLVGVATGGKDEYGNELTLKDELKKMLYLVPPTGGNQIKKTYQGLSMFDEDLPVTGSYTDSGNLRFPVEDTPLNKIQAALFGQWANKNAGEYFDNERQPLKEKQIQEYADLDMPISDYWEYRDGLKKQKTIQEKFDYINGLDLSDEQKNIMINNAVDRKDKIDISNYDDFGSYEEFDFATKNEEKYNFFQENNISFEDYNASEESREAYNWAFNNPESYVVSKAISDVVTYRKYASELNDIKADKDEDGKSISGSRKEKVIDYINNLDVDYGSKLILYKTEYSSDNNSNQEIINYLNERNDINYDEMATILTKLGMKVDSYGNISW